jgi:hypothetical protein
MPDPDTDAWLADHRFDARLDHTDERGSETTRGTFGRGRSSVEAGWTASALDDVSGARDGAPNAARTDVTANAASAASHSPTLAIGGTTTMSLNMFERIQRQPAAAPAPSSMRIMETGLALVAIAVALLLNLGR